MKKEFTPMKFFEDQGVNGSLGFDAKPIEDAGATDSDKTPESMKLTWREKLILMGAGALMATVGISWLNSHGQPSVANPDQDRGVETIKQNELINSMHDNSPSNTTIHVVETGK